MVVTKHAKSRIKTRLGIKKKSSDKLAANALQKGLSHAELKGSVKKYISDVYLKYRTANNIRIYNHQIFLFHGTVLITVFPLPQKYFACIEKIKKKHETNK